ncbi:CheW-like domain protein [mine drainage metagenome]|uniref:CheW-like domain protein n=1 Tax=mine drainage metagenome TaxID=410659 RepID=A0A1J5PTZ6_9ZZZZ
MVCAGREYLVRTFGADGYQGYPGPPGWQGQVMIPVDVAFSGGNNSTLAALDPGIAAGLLSHAQTFSPPLYAIMTAAETIQRVVWNGQVMTTGQSGERTKLKTILDQISETGARSNELFSKSIADLYETVLASSLRDSEFVSHLLIDLMDRNLYERSDDCRWWALTSELRTALAAAQRESALVAHIHRILEYINRLYTVYTRIFVYDTSGCIIASTGQDGAVVVGTPIDPVTLARVCALRSEQDYYVTPFAPTPLYDGQATYIYHAAIRAPEDDATVVGGIGIVFDATPEFLAMLRGGLGSKPGMNALFVDRQGCVLSSTDPTRPVGSILKLDPSLLALPNGASASRIVIHDNHYAVMGCTVSSGYREFKVTDGYREDVLAFVFDSLGEVREHAGTGHQAELALTQDAIAAEGREFATFIVAGSLFALSAEHVLQALQASKMSSVSKAQCPACIGLMGLQSEVENNGAVWVFDLGYLLRGLPSVINHTSQVIIVRLGAQTIGLLVDALHGVPKFNATQIMPSPFADHADGALVKHFIKANGGKLLIQAVDITRLFAILMGREAIG